MNSDEVLFINWMRVYKMNTIKALLALMSIVVTTVFLYFTNHLNVAFCSLTIALYIASSSIHLISHECGHLIGGIASGYKFLYFQIGPLKILSDEGKVSFKWEKPLAGQCVMIPDLIYPVRFKAYNLGGIFANFVIVILWFPLLSIHSFWSSLLLIEIILVGIKKILINIIPYKSSAAPNDGYIVMLLKRGAAVQKDYAMYLRLYREIVLEKPIVPQQYTYERENCIDQDELLYYTEIQTLLNSYRKQNPD